MILFGRIRARIELELRPRETRRSERFSHRCGREAAFCRRFLESSGTFAPRLSGRRPSRSAREQRAVNEQRDRTRRKKHDARSLYESAGSESRPRPNTESDWQRGFGRNPASLTNRTASIPIRSFARHLRLSRDGIETRDRRFPFGLAAIFSSGRFVQPRCLPVDPKQKGRGSQEDESVSASKVTGRSRVEERGVMAVPLPPPLRFNWRTTRGRDG